MVIATAPYAWRTGPGRHRNNGSDSSDAAKDARIGLLDLPADQLTGLPPTIVVTDERDVLRSQGQDFAHHLQTAGVEVTTTHYDGMMHEFFGAAAVLDKAEEAQQHVADHFKQAFAMK